MSQLQSINHIVVLMLENRSFDSLLGMLYPKSDGFEGLLPNRIPMRVARRLSSGTARAPTKLPCAFLIRIPASCGPTSTCNCSAILRRRRARQPLCSALSKIIWPNSN